MPYPVPENLVLRAAQRATPSATARLQHVAFEQGQPLWEAGAAAPHAFFPLRGLLSLQISPGPGKRVELAMVGREGFAGVALSPGSDHARASALALSAGEAFVMSRESFRRAQSHAPFRSAVERYERLYLTVLSRTLLCNRVHVIEKLCIGRLLQIQDRMLADTFHLTQDAFARHLGVRRATVSRAVTGLQRAGVISYDRHGRISIVNRSQLERLACPCYHAIKSEFDEHVGQHGGL